MNHRSILLGAAVAVLAGLLLACPRPAEAYIDILPPTLGDLCRQATHIQVVKVDKVSAKRGVILFKPVEQLKAGDEPLPGTFAKLVIGSDVAGAKVILDWATEGKTAVVFARGGDTKGVAHIAIDGSWYLTGWNANGWTAWKAEPTMLLRYCGPADKLANAVTRILKGEEVVVPAMAGDDRKALLEGRGKVEDVRASLKLLGNPKQNIEAELKTGLADDAKPGEKKPDPNAKPGEKKPEPQAALVGTVKAVADDNKSFTLVLPPTEKNKEPVEIPIQLTDRTKIIVNDGAKLTTGQVVTVWLEKGDAKVAVAVQLGKPIEKPVVKPLPGEKPGEKTPMLVGVVKAIAADGKSFTLELPPTEKNKEPNKLDIQLTDRTKIVADSKEAKLKPGLVVSVWLEKADAKVAVAVQIGKPGEKPPVKPIPGEKPGKPGLDDKPEAPRKPRDPNKPVRNPAPTATVIDTELDRQLAALKATAAPEADDAEFLRRVTLDLTGRIPTYAQTVAFLDSKEPDKRRKLIDDLLDSPAYGEHFATIWKNLMIGRDRGLMEKGRGDGFRPWLVGQFNDNHPWDALVRDFLTAEGTPNDNPATAFLIANSEQGQPQPNKIAGSTAALFWGVNLRCAECHDHPFIPVKQTDFWGTAAFFAKVQYGGNKGGPQTVNESATGGTPSKVKGQPSFVITGSSITIPTGSGKASGKVVKARFLGGEEPALDEKEPFRPTFARWATSTENPYFAKATVNRMWAHFFGRGLVNPLDGFDESNPASHPELLDKLAKEFAASGFDLQHLARCITTSKAYQRSSHPAPDNKPNPAAFDHMAVKVLTPEAFYDSVSVIMRGNTDKQQDSRDLFLRAFRFDDEVPATEYIQGIPQLLRLMNGPLLNRNAPVVDRLVTSGTSHADAVTTLYLTVLSRRPTDDELKLMESYLSKRKDNREGYRGVLWILLNTSEFALNH